MTVVVTGAGGQLGLDLLDVFERDRPVGLTHADLNVTDRTAVKEAMRRLEPKLVVHAAAWTDVDGCESEPDRAHRTNALGCRWVAEACRDIGAAMVMLSTDYVFGGRAGGIIKSEVGEPRPYSETDPVEPLNAYGRSKAMGEDLVRDTLDEHYIVRTSWVSGARGSNFITTMLRAGRHSGEVQVVDDQVGSPTFTRDLAFSIRELALSGLHGTWHRTNSGTCSWFQLAVAIFEQAGMQVEVTPISSEQLPRLARRPPYSVLSNRKAEAAGLARLRHWRNALSELVHEILSGEART